MIICHDSSPWQSNLVDMLTYSLHMMWTSVNPPDTFCEHLRYWYAGAQFCLHGHQDHLKLKKLTARFKYRLHEKPMGLEIFHTFEQKIGYTHNEQYTAKSAVLYDAHSMHDAYSMHDAN